MTDYYSYMRWLRGILRLAAFPAPRESDELPSWALAIVLSATFISLLWFAALGALVRVLRAACLPPTSVNLPHLQIFHEIRRRRRYLWIPNTPSPPPPKHLSPSREPSFLSGHPPPSISPHASLEETPSAGQEKEGPPTYNGETAPPDLAASPPSSLLSVYCVSMVMATGDN